MVFVFNYLLQFVILLEFSVRTGQVIKDNGQFNFLNGVQYSEETLRERRYSPAKAITGSDLVIKKKHTSLLRRVPCGGEITCLAIVRITA
jgi:hypothetical protein